MAKQRHSFESGAAVDSSAMKRARVIVRIDEPSANTSSHEATPLTRQNIGCNVVDPIIVAVRRFIVCHRRNEIEEVNCCGGRLQGQHIGKTQQQSP